jgi:TolB-like protein/DNA-binding winged helix-turn-helix (wHTH) protein/Tfp pilus assembly protein PilF
VTPALLKFVDFELDYSRYELRRLGRPLKLEKIPMELLQLLAESDGRLVTREEIEERLWGKEVFVDAEHGINTAIRKIRQVLGDDPDQPRFVQTVPRKGYRFIAKVSRVPAISIAPAGPSTIPEGAKELWSGEISSAPPLPAGALPLREDSSKGKEVGQRKKLWMVAAAAALLLVWPVYKLAPLLARHTPQPVAIRSIAVLPLENLSGDPAQEFFADGMTDELITMLAKYKSLRVISRTSVMQYKKARRPLPEIARELGVDGIVEGSVSRSKDRVRVTAQLVYAPTDTHIWAESYDRDLRDTLLLQQELAAGIAERVELASAHGESSPRPSRAPVSPEARDAYLRGRYYWFSERYEKSREFLQEATRLDPSYAAAYAGLADSYAAQAVVGELRPLEAMPLAEAASKKALELDDSLAEAHHASAAIKLFYHWDWDGTDKELRRAIELNPSLAESHHLRAYALSAMNRTEEMLQEDKTALELDPFARPWMYGYALIRARRFDEAVKELKQRSEARPSYPLLHAILGDAYLGKGDYSNAIEEMKKALVLEGDDEGAKNIDKAYRTGGVQAVNLMFLNNLKKSAVKGYVSSLRMAETAAGAGCYDDAFHYLDQAFEQRDPMMIHLQHNPDLDPLHSDPRYWAIVKKMNMPELR